jgi:tripartite-type tricarboxylate transporter receptor subunit TctC
MAALMTGDIDLLFATGPVAATNMKTGRIRCLAVASPKKAAAFPGLPTMNSVIPDFSADNWYAMFFPKGTPQNIVDKMNQAIKTALKEKRIAVFYEREGLEPIASSPAELTEMFDRDIKKYGDVIRKANIKIR